MRPINRCASRERFRELTLVHRAHRGKVSHVNEEHVNFDHVVGREAGGREHSEGIRNTLLSLGCDTALDEPTCRWIERRLAGEIDGFPRLDCRRLGPHCNCTRAGERGLWHV
jgi:hypothetical protein